MKKNTTNEEEPKKALTKAQSQQTRPLAAQPKRYVGIDPGDQPIELRCGFRQLTSLDLVAASRPADMPHYVRTQCGQEHGLMHFGNRCAHQQGFRCGELPVAAVDALKSHGEASHQLIAGLLTQFHLVEQFQRRHHL